MVKLICVDGEYNLDNEYLIFFETLENFIEDINEELIPIDIIKITTIEIERIIKYIDRYFNRERFELTEREEYITEYLGCRLNFSRGDIIPYYALMGDIRIIEYAQNRGFDVEPYAMECAIKSKKIDCVKYMKMHYKKPNYGPGLCFCAIIDGNLEILKYFVECGCECNSLECSVAASCGKLECLKYLREIGCSIGRDTIIGAIEGGHIDCVKYLHTSGIELDTQMYNPSVIYGHVECVKYLHEAGVSAHSGVNYLAAINGRLECLKYLHSIGLKGDVQIFFVALYGHIDCIKYLHDIGYLMDEDACLGALGSTFDDVEEGLVNAETHRRIECIEYFESIGLKLPDDACDYAAQNGEFEILKYLHERGFRLNEDTRAYAAEGGNIRCSKYILEHS